MIVIIRIYGMVDVPKAQEKILDSLRLRRKYSCVVIDFYCDVLARSVIPSKRMA